MSLVVTLTSTVPNSYQNAKDCCRISMLPLCPCICLMEFHRMITFVGQQKPCCVFLWKKQRPQFCWVINCILLIDRSKLMDENCGNLWAIKHGHCFVVTLISVDAMPDRTPKSIALHISLRSVSIKWR